ncbi:RNA polymerase subunit sigma-70 [Nocardioides nitrophenolicus]|uniref:RNA polymerase subunit sigma-70 n=1 Tax=Nocardioides nitrophenolicus TaxID=60489 RepID=UPI00195A2D49|nr:RNA polymerase subunit sigma-70 [Nocardioides nitrophenolicus]MBM7515245.1 RNA polymerase sigma-70 factor (ECF subfamily) [Nocardioides nitrophenolicus]
MTTYDDPGFAAAVEPFRGELTAHCYRMLGSVQDAEDVVQETYLRAWRARDQYDEQRASLRTWLYRIATNAGLTALRGRGRRPLPSGLVPETDPRSPFELGEVPWLQPIPSARVPDADPASLRLAFVAALQHLSPRQRAVLVLRDVLDFSAAETADVLDTTVVSVNSALLRARSAMSRADADRTREPDEAERRVWIDRYTAAFVAADVEALKRLLAADVVMEMPPMTNWFTGPEKYGVFMDWVYTANGTDWRTLPVEVNGGRGFAAYVRKDDGRYHRHTLQVLAFSPTGEGVTRNSVFVEADVLDAFGLPSTVAR